MSFTIKDVAREANVSIATVSRVINGQDRVKKETREKIQRAIEKFQYLPNRAARTMINKKTKTIGMIVPLLSNEYWATLVEMIQKELLNKGYTLIIGTSNVEQENYYSSMSNFLERKVDGLIIGGSISKSGEEKYLGMFIDQGIPLISLSSIFTNITSVSGDSMRSSMGAVEHLICLGHRKIAFIGTVSTTLDRELGYRNELTLNNIEVNEDLIVSGRNEIVHNFSKYGYECAKQLIIDNKEFTALFCANDLIAIGAIKAFEEFDIFVPRDKAVIGFDDISMAALYRPALTTVQQPIKEMARTVVDILIEQVENPYKDFVQKNITFPGELIVRESCGSKKSS